MVRKGMVRTFRPSGIDVMMPEHYHAVAGQRVRVVQLPSAPKPGTMGQCHIEDANTHEFLGMVSVHSLRKE